MEPKMKNKELFEKDEKALSKLLTETQAKMLKDRFAIAGREMTNVSEVNKSRKLIARIKTILRQKQILATEAAIEKETAKKAKGEK
jgi:ribosomal protein L29